MTQPHLNWKSLDPFDPKEDKKKIAHKTNDNFNTEPILPIPWALSLFIILTSYLLFTLWPLFFRFVLRWTDITNLISHSWLLCFYNSVAYITPLFVGLLFFASFYGSKVYPHKPRHSPITSKIVAFLKDRPVSSIIVIASYYFVLIILLTSGLYTSQKVLGFPAEEISLETFINSFDWFVFPFKLNTLLCFFMVFGLCIPLSESLYGNFVVELLSRNLWKRWFKERQCSSNEKENYK